jgi:hypothetical protein
MLNGIFKSFVKQSKNHPSVYTIQTNKRDGGIMMEGN